MNSQKSLPKCANKNCGNITQTLGSFCDDCSENMNQSNELNKTVLQSGNLNTFILKALEKNKKGFLHSIDLPNSSPNSLCLQEWSQDGLFQII